MASKPPTPPPAAAANGAAAAGATTPTKASALAAWLPLILTLTLMPVLAWATMNFLVLPKLQKALAKPAAEEAADPAEADAHGEKTDKADKTDSHGKPEKADSHGKPAKADAHGKTDKPDKSAAAKTKDGKAKVLAPLTKVLVNVFGTGGARYLIVSMTLVGNTPEFKTKVEENKDQLLDAAASTLASKSITDLERLGVRNQIRAELVSVFNTVLKATPVQEIYLTEFAVQ